MHSPIAYLFAAGAGLVLAWLLTCDPDLRSLRLTQLVLVPMCFVAALYEFPDPSMGQIGAMGSFVAFIVIIGFLGVLLAPNFGHLCGAAFSGFLDRQDWTPSEEEIALRPIVRLINGDHFGDALAEMEKLLKKHKPTYEALHIQAKLLHHFQRIDETVATLLQMIRLSHTTDQQLGVMQLLATLDSRQGTLPRSPVREIRRIRIIHELVLFDSGTSEYVVHKEIPTGDYQVEEILHGNKLWLVLKGERWGNAETCWGAVREIAEPSRNSAKKGFLYRVARLQQDWVIALRGKPRRQSKAEASSLYKEAAQLIRQGEWARALPLLQKASDADPDNYEIAYRLVKTAYQVGPPSSAGDVLRKVLAQSRWTEDEERMLTQLKG